MFKQNLYFKEFLDLSKKNYSLQITNHANEYPRLSDVVMDDNVQTNKIVSDIRLSNGSSMNPKIMVTSDVSFALECQRCLGSVSWNESLNIDCEIINDEESSFSNETHINRITVDEEGISIAKIIEDEILSIIPMSIMHKSIELCENNDTLSLFLSNNETKETLDKKKRPFSELSKILKKGKK
jgi:uncharacterized metal-binding protein YceD (DUF177 family)